jgi:Flp pilus assembly protein TadG
MIELALSAGVMVACFSGVFQFGYTFYTYNQLVSAVGNGARYAALRPYRNDPEKAKAAIQNMVVYSQSKPSATDVPVAKGLRPEHVKVEWKQDASGTPEAVQVSIEHYAIDALFGVFEFHGKPAVEFPFVGRYAPSEPEP